MLNKFKRVYRLILADPQQLFIYLFKKIYSMVVKKVCRYRLSSTVSISHQSERPNIDLVYTWVNHEDKIWQKLYAQHSTAPLESEDANNNTARYKSRDELKYSLRSFAKFAPWIDKVYIVSNCHPPNWLDLNRDDIRWVYHNEIFPKEHLPTFNSHAIEANLHKIEGLSEHYIYANDDFFLASPARIEDFFIYGKTIVRFNDWMPITNKVINSRQFYLTSAANAKRLLQKNGYKTSKAIYSHTPQAYLKSSTIELNNMFKKDFFLTSAAKFRCETDISINTYLLSHYNLATGRAIKKWHYSLTILCDDYFEKKLNIVKNQMNSKTPWLKYFCINDSGDSYKNSRWNQLIKSFLPACFPNLSKYEK